MWCLARGQGKTCPFAFISFYPVYLGGMRDAWIGEWRGNLKDEERGYQRHQRHTKKFTLKYLPSNRIIHTLKVFTNEFDPQGSG